MAIKQISELEQILQTGVDNHAQEIILIPGEPVIYRISGQISRSDTEPLTTAQIEKIAIAAVGEEALASIGTKNSEVQTSCTLPGVIEGRLNVARAGGDYTIIIGLYTASLPSPKVARIPSSLLDATENSSDGIIIISGPTGSAKHTIGKCLLDHINATKFENIHTIEEESLFYRLSQKKSIIQQHEVGLDVPDLVSGIRATLPLGAGIIYVQSVKNAEEIDVALTAAEMGLLVIVVMHGTSAFDLIQDLNDMHDSNTQKIFRKRFARALRAISNNRLIREKTDNKKSPIYEVLIPDDELRRSLNNDDNMSKYSSALPEGSQKMSDDVRKLLDEGIVSSETADEFLRDLEE